MFWTLDLDDFTGNFCGQVNFNYGLIKNLNNLRIFKGKISVNK